MPIGTSRTGRAAHRVRAGAAVAAVLVALVASGCARGPTGSGASPLTGLPGGLDGPVLAVKVDNARAARPWTGLEDADVVYVEPVEGGSTRLLAVFSSRRPASVGPVRSFRESDLDVLAAYGRPGLVFSGSAPELAGTLAAAPVVPLSPDTAAGAFRRDDNRSAPDNLYADPTALLGAAAGATGPADVGFTFGPAPAGGTPPTRRTIAVGQTSVGLAWDAGAGRFQLSFDGRPATTSDGARLGAATLVVQHVETVPSSVRDVAGAVSPKAQTVGSGDVEILRDGQEYAGRWSRASAQSPTSYAAATTGATIPFSTGPVWVLLVPQG